MSNKLLAAYHLAVGSAGTCEGNSRCAFESGKEGTGLEFEHLRKNFARISELLVESGLMEQKERGDASE